MRTRVIVNPRAGSGTAIQKEAQVVRDLTDAGWKVEVTRTHGPGDAPRIVREARDASVDCVVVIGGDGTLNEACQAYVTTEGEVLDGPELAVVTAGTGGDFRKTFDVGSGVTEAVRRIVEGPARALDLGFAELTDNDGQRTTRAYVNITSFGLGGLTDRIVDESPKWLGGKTAFFMGALRAILAYSNLPVMVKVDGKPCLEAPILNVAIANGRFFGGGMKIAPDADPSDGQLDVVALYDLSRAQGIGLACKIYQGTHPGSRGVRVARGSVVEAVPARRNLEVLIDMDGETPGRLPMTVRVLPKALRFRI